MRRLIALGMLAAVLSIPLPASAAASCTIHTSPAFHFTNAYDVFAAAAAHVSSGLIFSCTASGLPYTVSISQGLHGPNVANREMLATTGGDVLQYNLYVDAAYTTIFGDGTFGSQTVGGTTGTAGTRITIPIYGQLPARQDVAAGTYRDRLTLTISY